jgi:hypothetical protein
MQSTLNPKQTDDPHDFVVVPPGVARVAPADEELSNLLHKAARYSSSPQARAASDVAAGPTVPPVDATFRPAAVGDVSVPGKRWPMVRRAARALLGLLLAACIGLAAVAWRSYGETAKKQIAKWTTQVVLTSSLSDEKPAPPAQPAAPEVQADAATSAPAQPAAPAETAAEAVAPAAAAPSADSAQLIQSMARDLASLGQQVEQLKASIEELKASQQQISRDVAKVSEQNPRPRTSAVSAPPRPAVARPHKPIPPYPAAQTAVAPPLQQTAAPYVPRQPDYYAPRPIEPPPQTTAEPSGDPELSSVPRPPMPVR